MGIDNETERRKASIPIEKWIGYFLSGATLAFIIYESGAAYLDRLHTDLERIAREHAVLSRDVEFYRAESAAWGERVRVVESKCAEVRERIGVGKSQ